MRCSRAATPTPWTWWGPATRYDVRLCLRRDRRADARAHLHGPPALPRLTRRARAASSPGCAPTARARSPWSMTPTAACCAAPHRGLHPARPRTLPSRTCGRQSPRPSSGPSSRRFIDRRPRSTSTHRPLRGGRPGGRHRPHRPEDHRGHYGGSASHGGGCFSGKDPTKVTARPPIWPGTRPRTWWLPDWPDSRSSWPTPSAWPIRCPCWWNLRHRTAGDERWRRSWTSTSTCAPRPSSGPGSAPSHLEQTAAYGHFGRTDIDLPWERTDRAETLKQYLK
jgi:hypothetical protein